MLRLNNQARLRGHLGQDPELRSMPNGDPVCNFSIATNESWSDKETGEKKEKTEWHNIVCFRKTAEIAEKYLNKGDFVDIQGTLRNKSWTDENDKKHRSTEIHAEFIENLSKKSESTNTKTEPVVDQPSIPDTLNEDIPF